MNTLLLNINKDKCSGHESFLKYSLWVVNFFDPYGATADDDWMDGCMMDEWMDGWWMDDDGWMEQMQLMLKPRNQKSITFTNTPSHWLLRSCRTVSCQCYQTPCLTGCKKHKLSLHPPPVLRLCPNVCYITTGSNHTGRPLAPVKWKGYIFMAKFVLSFTDITMRLVSHSLNFHICGRGRLNEASNKKRNTYNG